MFELGDSLRSPTGAGLVESHRRLPTSPIISNARNARATAGAGTGNRSDYNPVRLAIEWVLNRKEAVFLGFVDVVHVAEAARERGIAQRRHEGTPFVPRRAHDWRRADPIIGARSRCTADASDADALPGAFEQVAQRLRVDGPGIAIRISHALLHRARDALVRHADVA